MPRLCLVAFALTIGISCRWLTLPTHAGDFIWLEGEQPTATNVEVQKTGWGNTHFLSDGNWVHCTIDAKQIAAEVPDEGVLLQYEFQTTRTADYEVWSRIGFEFVRSPFDWRIDDGKWQRVDPQDLTTDLMEIATWCEVAWLKLGTQALQKGRHTFTFRLPRTKDEKGEWQRILFACDAICLTPDAFTPNSKFKPGEDGRDERDRQAAENVFDLPEPATPGDRVLVSLSGLWEICRHDEQLPGATAEPIRDFPDRPCWKAIQVPGDKNKLRPDLLFAHRLWYRTRFEVPESLIGRSFFLVFPANSLNTTIRVNDQFCGFDKNPFARLQFDITESVKPGMNELSVGIKDGWYAYLADPRDPLKLRRRWNLPLQFFGNGFQELVYPIWNQKQMGIIGTPQLVAAGSAYVSDVFCKPSVRERQLGLEIELRNNQPTTGKVDLVVEAIDDSTNEVAKRWPPVDVLFQDGNAKVVMNLPWQAARLWWPDEPHCYRLRTTLSASGKTVDRKETLFGFREWTCDGIQLRLNGIKWQGFTEHGVPGTTPQEYLASLKDPRFNYGFGRMWPQHGGRYKWLGEEPEEVLTRMDRGGALIRRTGYLDGEAAGYMPAVLPELGGNWIDHLVAWIRGERNHPSIMIWSVENELNFINARNLGQLDKWEPVLTRAWEAVQKVDPTRPIMIDGGGATRAQTLPVHGDHYTTKPFWNYPQLAYEANADQPPWTWDQQRPKFIGEELFAAGINPAYAYFGGEQVFLGKMGNRPAVGKAMQIISQGYRWAGITACDFCQQPSDADGSQYNGWAPRAVLVRQWDFTFASGSTVTRTVGIFNNTRFTDPLTFSWKLALDGKEIAAQSTTHQVPPGECEKFDVSIPVPRSTDRLEGEWTLTLSACGEMVFRDVKAVSVLPAGDDLKLPASVAGQSSEDLYLYDPTGKVTEFLEQRGVHFTAQPDLDPPSVAGKTWLIGPDALAQADASSSAFAAYASGGGRVVLLEQQHPLRYQGLAPAEMEYQENTGRTAFIEDGTHPLLRGLEDKDFFTWEPGEVVYENAYLKPERGARSLVQCNESLINSALVTIPVNDGVVTLCQLVVGQKAALNPVAERVLINALDFSATYRLEFRDTVAAVETPLKDVLDAISLKYESAATPLAALAAGQIAVVSATPENLSQLAAHQVQVQVFNEEGGWLVLHDLTPAGLEHFNQLVGVQHMIRPFRRERVTIALPRNRLLSGVPLSDLALYSSEKIFAWQSGQYVASDTFRFVVDIDEVAPFGEWDSDAWYNFVNGMVSADGWKYIQNHPTSANTYVLTLPRPQQLTSWIWDGNILYNSTRRVELIFDDDEAGKMSFDVPSDGEPARLEIHPPRTAQKIAIRHIEFDDLPEKRQNGQPIIGCDNVSFFASRPDDFRQRVKQMLGQGGLVEYPRGRGGIVLVNLQFKETEELPINGVKKRNVLAAILRNLKAPFGGGRTVIPGARLAYQPIDISPKATQFRSDRGWYGDKRFTFRDLPVGPQRLAGVNYDVYDFPTSPVPNCIMLAGPKVPNQLPEQVKGIPIHQKADALFFLHTARIDRRRNERQKKENQTFELVRYVIHYADGQEITVPILSEFDIDDYKVREPKPLPGAQLAWTQPYDDTPFHAALYSKQWNNPFPEKEIESVDMLYGEDRVGVPVLIALTAARRQ